MGRMSRLNSTFLSLAPAKLGVLKAVNSPTQSQFKFETRMISNDTLTATSDEVSRTEVCWETPIASKPI